MHPPKQAGSPRGATKSSSWGGAINFTIRAAPLPASIREFLIDNTSTIFKLRHGKTDQDGEDIETEELGATTRRPTIRPDQFWSTLEQQFRDAGGEWKELTNKVWSFGPHWAGSCILVDTREQVSPQSYAQHSLSHVALVSNARQG